MLCYNICIYVYQYLDKTFTWVLDSAVIAVLLVDVVELLHCISTSLDKIKQTMILQYANTVIVPTKSTVL